MFKNDANDFDLHSIQLETTQTSANRLTRLCAFVRRRKLTWIIIASIVVVLIISAIVVPTTIVILKKKISENTSSDTETMSTMASAIPIMVSTEMTTTSETTTKDIFLQLHSDIVEQTTSFVNIDDNSTKWVQHAVTVAGGNGSGNRAQQLNGPYGMDIDENYTIYIADQMNHRIVQWRRNSTLGEVVAGGNGEGNGIDQLQFPSDVVVSNSNDALVICDLGNRRIVRWSRWNNTAPEIIIASIRCLSVTMDNNGDLYISDPFSNVVMRWSVKDRNRTILAGGTGNGNELHQLNAPNSIFIDEDQSIYISDLLNHRVLKWGKGATKGVVVAGGNWDGIGFNQLDNPRGLFVDQLGNVYVADRYNHRVMCWAKEAQKGRLIVGGNGRGDASNQFNEPADIIFDREGNLYVTDYVNHRVQKFNIMLN